MAITSVGYPGPIGAPEWAGLASSLGADYGVVGPGDLRVSVVSAADRTVKVAVGKGYGKGVFDSSSAEETIQLASISSGSRWDLVGLQRTWDGEDSATTVAGITGTASQTAVFASRPATPGTSDFQPLALVQVTFGSTVPTAVIDLRVWQANGGAVANHVLALQYLNGAGTEVWIGTDVWHRYVDGAGALQWSSMPTGSLPHVRLSQAADQQRSGGQWGQVSLTSSSDVAGPQPWTYSGGAVTITEAGLYQIEANVSMTVAGFSVQIYRTAGGVVLGQSPTGSGASLTNGASCTRRLNAGDVIVVRVFPAATANVEADEASKPSTVTFTKLSA